MADFDLESLIHVEQNFYDSGYTDGFDHGRIHGLIEGRALGREKGFEMWEELGFYEGFALTWKGIFAMQGREDDRASNHIRHLLELIAQFPRVNLSASDTSSELDIPKLFRQIRSRYKALCSTLGVRPSLRAAENNSPAEDEDTESQAELRQGLTVTGNGGERKNVWKVEGKGRPTGQDLSF
ncbi:DUF1715-domain-containing protein [Crucibulum laeve]|uniref:DUF1715-domain-containing protein n=1 Tax=Crucibulum laeve TaxID=68775 RepID=A0A5C3M651_9AGAR|nr:DUF1715-domain-containing protein [Crucibulum laeve]